MRIQGLNPQNHAIIWWRIGGAPFFQLEFFSHGSPKQRPQPADWRPCDRGWVRFGIAVNTYDHVVDGLARWNVTLLGTAGTHGHRRLGFRDPHVGCMVEVMESSATDCPTMTY